MPTPLRILRAHADERPDTRPKLSARELDRQDRILDTARSLMARFGRAGLTFTGLAGAMRLAPATIRRLFPDLDTILAHLLTRHLLAISRALGEIPPSAPNRHAAQRAAYVTFTRNAFSATTDIHTLLIRERHALPPDLLDPLEDLRSLIGEMLGPDHAETILSLLDNPFLQPPQIEAMLTALQNPSVARPKIKSITYPHSVHPRAPAHPAPAFPPPAPQARDGPIATAI